MFIGQFKVLRGQKDHKGQKGRKDNKDQWVLPVHKVRPVRKGQPARWDCPESEYKDLLDRKVHPVRWVRKELRANLEWMDYRVFKDRKVFRVRKANQGRRDRLEVVVVPGRRSSMWATQRFWSMPLWAQEGPILIVISPSQGAGCAQRLSLPKP
jgi:hypothetical protein